VTDLDTLLPGRLRNLADEHAPSRDPLVQAAAARARHRLQRRTRLAATGIVAAVAAIAIGVPLTFSSLAAAPGHGVAATTPTSAPSRVTEQAPAQSAEESGARSAERSAAESALAAARSAAELQQAVALMEPLAFGAAPPDDRCSWLDPGPLDAWMRLGSGLSDAVGPGLSGRVSGCRFASVTTPGAPGGTGVELSVGYLPATSVANTLPRTDPDGGCATADLPSSPAGAVLQRCATDAGSMKWWVHAPAANGATYVLGVTVDDRWTGISGPEVIARFASCLSRNW
jgi:hypothetical protein